MIGSHGSMRYRHLRNIFSISQMPDKGSFFSAWRRASAGNLLFGCRGGNRLDVQIGGLADPARQGRTVGTRYFRATGRKRSLDAVVRWRDGSLRHCQFAWRIRRNSSTKVGRGQPCGSRPLFALGETGTFRQPARVLRPIMVGFQTPISRWELWWEHSDTKKRKTRKALSSAGFE